MGDKVMMTELQKMNTILASLLGVMQDIRGDQQQSAIDILRSCHNQEDKLRSIHEVLQEISKNTAGCLDAAKQATEKETGEGTHLRRGFHAE